MFEGKPTCQYKRGVSFFEIPAVGLIQSACLHTQCTGLRALSFGGNVLIDVAQVYLDLL